MRQPSQARILIVDDMPQNLRLLAEILSARGYEIRPAISGEAAIRSVAAAAPDLILMDVRMPEMDGYEACRRIKNNKRHSHIPVIFISALDDVEDKLKGFRAGGVDYITKPFQEEEVLARVRTHLTLWFLQRQLAEKNRLLQLEIAERERVESALRSAYESIETQILERTEELRNAVRQLSEKEAEVRGILNAIPDIIFVLNREGRFLEYVANKQEDLYVPPEVFLSKSVMEVMPERLARLTMENVDRTLASGKTQSYEYELTIQNEERHFEAHMAVAALGQVVCVIRDITARKQIEETIRRVNDELEMKVMQRTRELQEMNLHLTRLNEDLESAYAELKVLNIKLDDLARIDPLTGLSNRRDLQEKFEIESSRAQRNGNSFAMIMGDIDHFKMINDNNGHECGDAVLKQLGELLRGHTRRSDTVARYGGEEFVILLSDTGLSGAREAAEKIRGVVEANDFAYCKQRIRVRISFGVCAFSGTQSFSACVEAVDRCLYEAKRTGRNRTVSCRDSICEQSEERS